MRISLFAQIIAVSAMLAAAAFTGVDLWTQVVPWVAGLVVIVVVAAFVKWHQTATQPTDVDQPIVHKERRKVQQILNNAAVRPQTQTRSRGPVYTPTRIARIHKSDGTVDEVIDCELVS